jgi:BirA family biotin operon repressor/biotin-[acetyl-CoA-carboxylase] ligase
MQNKKFDVEENFFTKKTFNFFKNLKSDFYKKIAVFEEIKSTNIKAKELAKNNEDEGTIILSKTQLMGRGRNKRIWHSPDGGLYISVILRPKVNTKNVNLFPLLGALSIVYTLYSIGIKSSIKWPNDVRINNRKISGILIESETTGQKIDYVILGIGINLNTDIDVFPEELIKNTTSIKYETGTKINYYKFLEKLLVKIEEYYNLYKNKKYDIILNQWRNNSDTLGKNVKIKMKEEDIIGRAIDIDNSGFLIIKTQSGEIKKIINGDCEYLIML